MNTNQKSIFSSQEEIVKVVAETIRKKTNHSNNNDLLCIYKHIMDIYYRDENSVLIPDSVFTDYIDLNQSVNKETLLVKKLHPHKDIVDMYGIMIDTLKERVLPKACPHQVFKKHLFFQNLKEILLESIAVGEEYVN